MPNSPPKLDSIATCSPTQGVYARVLRPGLAAILPAGAAGDTALRPYFDKLEAAIDRHSIKAKLAA